MKGGWKEDGEEGREEWRGGGWEEWSEEEPRPPWMDDFAL